MKHAIVLEVLRRLKSKPELMRKVKIFAVMGLIGFVVVTGLTIWAGFHAVNYAMTSAKQVVSSSTTSEHLQKATSELRQIQFQPLSCWMSAQQLMAVQPWLNKPVLENLFGLKTACLNTKPAESCEGSDCSHTKQPVKSADRRPI